MELAVAILNIMIAVKMPQKGMFSHSIFFFNLLVKSPASIVSLIVFQVSSYTTLPKGQSSLQLYQYRAPNFSLLISSWSSIGLHPQIVGHVVFQQIDTIISQQ
ncbi:hypothetical protein ACOSP7_005710 [Xanthoceras sorbifolium]